MDLFIRKVSSKLRNIPVLTRLETKEINLRILLTLKLVRNYQKGIKLGSKSDPSGTEKAIPTTQSCYL